MRRDDHRFTERQFGGLELQLFDLRRSTDRLGSSIEGLRTDISGIRTDISNQHSTFNGAGKVLSALGAVGLVLIGGFINHLLGA